MIIIVACTLYINEEEQASQLVIQIWYGSNITRSLVVVVVVRGGGGGVGGGVGRVGIVLEIKECRIS